MIHEDLNMSEAELSLFFLRPALTLTRGQPLCLLLRTLLGLWPWPKLLLPTWLYLLP